MRILMTTGGSLHSETALWLGAEIARRTPIVPTVLTVVASEKQRPEGELILQRADSILKKSIAAFRPKIRVGRVGDEILAEAEEGAYDLIVLGERQLHKLRSRITGTVAEQVANASPCSLLIAKGKIERIQLILICDSGARTPSLVSKLVTSPLRLLLEEYTEVGVLHVMSQMAAGPGVGGQQLRAGADELIASHSLEGQILEQDLSLLKAYDVHVHPLVRHGFVVDEILTEASQGDYDLIVIGAHQGSGWQRILLDDIAHKVSSGADRPVLILR